MRPRSPATVRRESGVTIVLQSLLMVPVLIAVALSVDVGAWYVQAADEQGAADAGALAGVVWLPDVAQATQAARDAAAANGFEHGVNATVDVVPVGDSDLRVVVTAEAPQYFSGILSDGIDITRSATARFVAPVEMGSPLSSLGTGPIDLGVGISHQWASISGYCTAKETGDRFRAGFDGNAWSGCPPPIGSGDATSVPNPEYRTEGYWYRINRPSFLPYRVRVFDAGLCSGATQADDTTTEAFDTVYTLYGPDSTPFFRYDNPVIASVTVPPETGCDAWSDLFTLAWFGPTGDHFLEVNTAEPNTGRGHNNYGVWVQQSFAPNACSVLSFLDCPSITAIDEYSININTTLATASFFLAEVDPVHHDKELVLELWDTADGMESFQILDPSGAPVEFTYETADGDYGPSPNDTCAAGPCLRVDAAGPQPIPGIYGTRIFNDRLLVLRIQLPDEATMTTWPNNWWRISYVAGSGTVYDRTTWAARVEGDPIRLVD